MFQQLTQQATHAAPILAPEDGPSFEVTNDLGISRVILVCEHASNRVPASLGSLGLTDEQLISHIAWDPGASDLSQDLSRDLDATFVEARFSRLVYDCNRPPEAVSDVPAESKCVSYPEMTTSTFLGVLHVPVESIFRFIQSFLASLRSNALLASPLRTRALVVIRLK
jgi:hypothetical protein